ncbi:MAG: heavy metal-responsive transcriptional regulator [Desulfomonilaceae bacterium]|nr:heavy metal-responsive transcriptional regulator [Desulfomonilaceae bacterium]
MNDATTKSRMTIGKVARRSGVGVETVRFYERNGLIPEPMRTDSGYRQYPEGIVSRILFIRRAKDLGFTLKEIKELLSLRFQPGARCADVRAQAEAKIAEMEEKIRTLESMKAALVRLTMSCRSDGPVSECPILEALDHDEHITDSSSA